MLQHCRWHVGETVSDECGRDYFSKLTYEQSSEGVSGLAKVTKLSSDFERPSSGETDENDPYKLADVRSGYAENQRNV